MIAAERVTREKSYLEIASMALNRAFPNRDIPFDTEWDDLLAIAQTAAWQASEKWKPGLGCSKTAYIWSHAKWAANCEIRRLRGVRRLRITFVSLDAPVVGAATLADIIPSPCDEQSQAEAGIIAGDILRQLSFEDALALVAFYYQRIEDKESCVLLGLSTKMMQHFRARALKRAKEIAGVNWTPRSTTYTQAERDAALVDLAESGSLSVTARNTGIPYATLKTWRRQRALAERPEGAHPG